MRDLDLATGIGDLFGKFTLTTAAVAWVGSFAAENITFTVQVANLGEATAANVVVRLVVDGVQLELQRTIAAAGLSVSAARREGRAR